MATVLKLEREKRPMGRPRYEYDHEIAEQICEAIATGTVGLVKLCRARDDWPSADVVRKWLISNDNFSEMYARARLLQADNFAEELIDIADDSGADLVIATGKDGKPYLKIEGEAVQRSKLRSDNRKWAMAKLNPARYGDKLDVTSGGEKLPAPNSVTIDARVQSIMLLAESRRKAAALFSEDE